MISTDQRIKIIVAEQNQFIRKGLVELIDGDRECMIASEVSTGSELIADYFVFNPDIIVTNVILDKFNGPEALTEIKSIDKHAKALFLSGYADDRIIYLVHRCGGMGCINLQENPRRIINAVKEIHAGKGYFPDNIEAILSRYSESDQYTGYEYNDLQKILSRREYEIFCLIGNGLSSREIADKLLISKKTVEYHLFNMKVKLNLGSRNQLICISAKHNLIYNNTLELK
jgi:DNA-binding NarL/FixJ family response regulator